MACGIANDAFETRLEDAGEFGLVEIKRGEINLSCKAPYNKANSHTYIYVVQKINAMRHALISSIDERGLQSNDE